MRTIVFDENPAGWTSDVDLDLAFLRYQADNINEMLKYRGYIYLNQIHEYFGVEWNPELVNTCYIFGSEKVDIKFEFEPLEDGRILIHIS